MKKRILSFALCALMLVSLLALAVGADTDNSASPAFEPVTERFNSLPASLQGVDGVSVRANTAMKVSFTDAYVDASANVWGYQGWLEFSDEPISEDTTLTFYMRSGGFTSGWNPSLTLCLSDSIGNGTENVLTGIAVWPNTEIFLASGDDNGKAAFATTGIKIVEEEERDKPSEWHRVDIQMNFTAKKVTYFWDLESIGTVDMGGKPEGYKGFRSYTVTKGNGACDYYVDELTVRKGIIDPVADDVASAQDRDAIEADESVFLYEPFDSLRTNTMSNHGAVVLSVAEIDAFNQSTLNVIVPRGEDDFFANIMLSETDLAGNATVNFKFKADYTVKTGPGLKIKLIDKEKKNLGGIVVGANCNLMFDDGTNVYNSKDADGAELRFLSGKWYNVSLLVNYTNKSLTVYLDGTRVGTVALEGDLSGFCGVRISKYLTTGTRNGNFTFDDISIVSGLFAPGLSEALADNDVLVTIDTEYIPPVVDPGDDDNNGNGDNQENNGHNDRDTDKNDNETTVPDTTGPAKKEEKGCKSAVGFGCIALLATLSLGASALIRKKGQ